MIIPQEYIMESGDLEYEEQTTVAEDAEEVINPACDISLEFDVDSSDESNYESDKRKPTKPRRQNTNKELEVKPDVAKLGSERKSKRARVQVVSVEDFTDPPLILTQT